MLLRNLFQWLYGYQRKMQKPTWAFEKVQRCVSEIHHKRIIEK